MEDSNIFKPYSYNIYGKMGLLINKDAPEPPDEADGISTCRKCNAKYAGKQRDRCQNIVICVPIVNYWGKIEYTETYNTGSSEIVFSKPAIYNKCSGWNFDWDLENKLREYQDFENFISDITSSCGRFERNAKYLSKEGIELILKFLPDKVSDLENKFNEINAKIEEIQQKFENMKNSF